ncbi:flavin-containing monooxygenase [Mycolicibacter minnesotensis]
MKTHHDVVVIGAGISGICAAIKLREAEVTDLVVLEKANAYGGTWRANTYPGCACDVPSRLYSFSFAQRPDWSRIYSGQPEILEYIESVAREHRLDEVTRFGVEVTGARWDAADRHWKIFTSDGELTARFLVAAAGPWSEPKIPDLAGLDEFPGEVFHSARWNHDYDVTGKQLAVIGSGASAVQFVPHLQSKAAKVHLFQRTAHWVLPKPDYAISRMERWALRSSAVFQRGMKSIEYGAMETVGLAFHRPKPLMHVLQALGRIYLRMAVRDRALRAKLTPSYLLGCKRILFSNDYLQSLGKPNVTVHETGVAEIRGTTVVGSDGSMADVDAIILGTGFHILDMPVADIIRGADGRTLTEHWTGSPEAYLGTTVTGFPNAFIVLGPSLGTGHSSAFTIVEAQVGYIVDAIRWSKSTDAVLDVSSEVQAAYIDEVQSALAGTAYNAASCNSYYVDDNGRNSFSWPWSTNELIRRVGRFDSAAFTRLPTNQEARR